MTLSEHTHILDNESGLNEKKSFSEILNNLTDVQQDKCWHKLINDNNPANLRTAFYLDYVFQHTGESISHSDKRIAVIAHINYTDLIDRCLSYIREIPSYIDIYITTKGEKNITILTQKIKDINRNNIKIVVPEDRGREISALLVACKDFLMQYEYLCFVHDKKSNSGCPIKTVGQSFCDILWENSIKNKTYIENVISKFEEEKHLGFLSPPIPYMSAFFVAEQITWPSNVENTKKLAKRLNLKSDITYDNPPFAFGTTFWCRTKALAPLFTAGLSYEDFDPEPMAVDNTISHAIERIFSYVSQSEGYYSGIMMTSEYASVYICNYQYMIEKIVDDIILPDFFDGQYKLFSDIPNKSLEIINQCNNHSDIYIYGCGNIGQRCLEFLNCHAINPKAFIVSDGYKEQNVINNIKVIEFSELTLSEDICIILAVGQLYRKDIILNLKRHGISDIVMYYGY